MSAKQDMKMPLLNDDQMTVTLSARIPYIDAVWLRAVATDRQVAVSTVVRDVIRAARLDAETAELHGRGA